MKNIIALCLFLLPLTAISQSTNPAFNITIENENSYVSPGGYVRVKIVGSDMMVDEWYIMSFTFDTDSVVEKVFAHYYGRVRWLSGNYSTPRFVKIKIKDEVSVTLPKTVVMTANFRGDKYKKAFQIKDGTHGHTNANVKTGDYHVTINPEKDVDSWYEIFCISSSTGYCSINIKNGEYDNKYHGHEVINVSNQTCSDRGYPGTSRLDIREPLVFDASRLIKTIENFTAPDHHGIDEIGACLFTSDNPFFIRKVDIADQK